MKPFVKCPGGKTRILPALVDRMPTDFDRYFEPFVGGGALFFAVMPRRASLSDASWWLIRAWEAVRDDVEGLIRELRRTTWEVSESNFYAVRDHFADLRPLAQAARAIYLNKTCFNGLWRVNKAGEFNMPWGQKRLNATLFNEDDLRGSSLALNLVEVEHCDFEATLGEAIEGDFVYLDPPYHNVFDQYTADGFGEGEHMRLAVCVEELTDRGVAVMLSNSDTPLVHELYDGYYTERIAAPRSISRDGEKRGNTSELLITNY